MMKYANEMCKYKTIGFLFAYVFIFDNKYKNKQTKIQINKNSTYLFVGKLLCLNSPFSGNVCFFFSSFEFYALNITKSGRVRKNYLSQPQL